MLNSANLGARFRPRPEADVRRASRNEVERAGRLHLHLHDEIECPIVLPAKLWMGLISHDPKSVPKRVLSLDECDVERESVDGSSVCLAHVVERHFSIKRLLADGYSHLCHLGDSVGHQHKAQPVQVLRMTIRID